MIHITSIAEDAKSSDMPDEIQSVLSYWNTMRGTRFAPNWKSIKLEEINPNAIPRCSVVDVIDDGKDYRYRFWGTLRHALQGKNMTEKSVRDLKPSELAEQIQGQYAEILKRRKPIWFKTHALIDGQREFEFQYLRLPISDNGEDINMIFGICHNRYSQRELESIFPPLDPIIRS